MEAGGGQGDVAGVGIFVGDSHILTCAHVIAKILGVDETVPADQVAGRHVFVDFPHLLGVGALEVQVLHAAWYPVRADGSGDVAVLHMDQVPTGAIPAPLRRPATLDGHRFAAKGFPRGWGGVNATGVLRGGRGPQGRWVQLEDVKTEGVAITGGFSGSPVWDYELSGVVGMIVSEYVDEQAKIGSMIPVEVIEEAWPTLRGWVRWRLDLDPQTMTHWLPRARGVLLGETEGWYFTGRRELLSELSDWLRIQPNPRQAMRVVTGPPGSGKSAILAWLVVLADPVLGPRVPVTDAERVYMPPSRAIDVAIYARDKTIDMIVTELAAAAEVPAESEEQLLAALGQRGQPFTIVIDALDEARPSHSRKIARLLADLATDLAGGGIRIIVGVRSRSSTGANGDLTDLLGRRNVLMAVDSPQYLEPADFVGYAYRRLVDASTPDCPYRHDRMLALTIATAVARRASPLFLVAQLTCQALILDPEPIDTSQKGWEQRLPSDVDRAFDRYLERFGTMERSVRDLFTALAYAEGPGLPAGQLWADMATALTVPRAPYQLSDIQDLLRSAASYVVEDRTVSGQIRYRLFHQELVDYFRRSRDQQADQQTVVATLRHHVPARTDGSLDWIAADFYTRTYAATHASKAGQLDALLLDPRFLLAADHGVLVSVLATAESLPAIQAAGVYRRSVALLRRKQPPDCAAYLRLHAHQAGAIDLAERLDQLGMPLPWTVRWAYWLAPYTYLSVGKHEGEVSAVAVGEVSGRPIGVSGGADGSVHVWDLTTGEQVGAPVGGHDGGVSAVAVGEVSGRPIAVSSSRDESRRGSVKVWDLHNATAQTLEVGLPVFAMAVSALRGEPILVCGTWPGSVRVWDLHSATAQTLEVGLPVFAMAVGAAAGQPILVCGSWDGSVRVHELTTGQLVGAPLCGHTGGVSAVAVGNVGEQPVAISGSADGIVRSWTPVTTQPAGPSARGHAGRVTGVAIGEANGQLITVSSNDDGSIRVSDLRGDPIQLIATGSPVFAIALANLDGRTVAVTGSWDQTVQVWDILTGLSIGEPMRGHSDFVAAVATGQIDGHPVVVSGSGDGTVRLWELNTRTPLREPLSGHLGEVAAVAIAEINQRPVVLSGAGDRIGRLWDPSTGATLQELSGHADQVSCVALGTAGDQILAVSGGWDGTIQVWDGSTGSPIRQPLVAHTSGVAAVTLAEIDERPLILSGGGDEAVRIWDLDGDEISTIELGSEVWGIAFKSPNLAAIATGLGLVFVELTTTLLAGGKSGHDCTD